MPTGPHIVLADDLTGAAEVAAIAFQAGRRALVLTRAPDEPLDADVLVLCTDTRLVKPSVAAGKVLSWCKRLAAQPNAGVFLKVDSVLRGSVLVHLLAAMEGLGSKRALLVPANPSLGRTVIGGRYFVNEVPLASTAFALDPHHPRTTSDVLELLGAREGTRVVCLTPTVRTLPAKGVVFGETARSDDVATWAGRVSAGTLPAGGAEFFSAWLSKGAATAAPIEPVTFTGGTLLVHGTTAAPSPQGSLTFRGTRAPAVASLRRALAEAGFACLAAPPKRPASADAPERISHECARVTSALHRSGDFKHLLIAGGATAAAVLSGLGWDRLEVLRVWAPGVVTLRPLDAPDATVTLKPGSYPWPTALRTALPTGLRP